jgi:predicted NUDIX family NTP pyrophosphohydrolase
MSTTRGDHSAGILAYRRVMSGVEVLLVHPGGPFWSKKDARAWSIPKGLFTAAEDPLEAARREFAEETGTVIQGDFFPLGSARQPSGKTIHAWAVEKDVDVSRLVSNTFEMEWPPKSGMRREFPEVDRGEWFSLAVAGEKIVAGQRVFLERLAAALGERHG